MALFFIIFIFMFCFVSREGEGEFWGSLFPFSGRPEMVVFFARGERVLGFLAHAFLCCVV